MNALVYVDTDQGIHKGKMKVALNEKRKKLCAFSFYINTTNFEAFLSVFKLTKNLFFLKSVTRYIKCNMLSKSSKWELGFVHYIKEFTISRFVISRFEVHAIHILTQQ